MASPFQAITTGDKSLAQLASEPIKAVQAEGQKRRAAGEGAYESYGYTFGNLPANQVPVAQQWADAVRDNLIEGYRTNNQDMIRTAKQQGRDLQTYIRSMEEDYTIAKNSLVRAREKNFQGLSENRVEIETGFENRYEVPISLETDGNGYPLNAVISGMDGMENKMSLGELQRGLQESRFIVVDAVNLGTNFNPEKISSRWADEVATAGTRSEAQQRASQYAADDIKNQMVAPQDVAIAYLVNKKAINVTNPSSQDVALIDQVVNDPERYAEAQQIWSQNYQNFLVGQWEASRDAEQRRVQLSEQASIRSEKRKQSESAEAGILSMTPFMQSGLKTYNLDTKGLRFDIGQGREVSEVSYDNKGKLSKVVVLIPSRDVYGNVNYNPEIYSVEDGTLTEGIEQVVTVNLSNLSGGKSGYNKLIQKEATANTSGAAGMLQPKT